jgi:hypothetical protein
MLKTIEIDLMQPLWAQHSVMNMMPPENTLKSELRETLWINGWRDGKEIKMTRRGHIIYYSFEVN